MSGHDRIDGPNRHPSTGAVPWSLGWARAVVGLLRLAFPAATTPGITGDRLGQRGRTVVRVLGARQVSQAVVTAPAPSAAVLWLGVEVDIAHAVSMIALAGASLQYRRPAMIEAVLAASFAAAGAAVAYRTPPGETAASPLGAWRDRRADQIARLMVPWSHSPRGKAGC